MALLVDTSVWSLALRRDNPTETPEVAALRNALQDGEDVHTCGIIVMELFRGSLPHNVRDALTGHVDALNWIEPQRDDYLQAAAHANTCRRNGVQFATIDALIAQLAIRGGLNLLTTDQDFTHAAQHIPLKLWST